MPTKQVVVKNNPCSIIPYKNRFKLQMPQTQRADRKNTPMGSGAVLPLSLRISHLGSITDRSTVQNEGHALLALEIPISDPTGNPCNVITPGSVASWYWTFTA